MEYPVILKKMKTLEKMVHVGFIELESANLSHKE